MGLQAVNHKRYYGVIKASSLLSPKTPHRLVSSLIRDGIVPASESNRRWYSDAFEIDCNSM